MESEKAPIGETDQSNATKTGDEKDSSGGFQYYLVINLIMDTNI